MSQYENVVKSNNIIENTSDDNNGIIDENNSIQPNNVQYEKYDLIDNTVEGLLSDDALLKNLLVKLTKKHGIRKLETIIDDINKDQTTNEPLLDVKNRKLTAFPITYPSLWKKYKEQMACMWKAEEIDFSNDYNDFMTLNTNEQHFIEMILAFFAASDGIVNFNLSERFTREIQITEALFAYQFQEMMENIHSEVYSLMLDNIVRDPKRKAFLFDAVKNVPSVKLMADWAFKWIDSSDSLAHRIVAFAVVEAVFFSGAFAAIFWIKKYKNKESNSKQFMAGLIKSNKFISRDEGLHCKFACELYGLIVNKLSSREVNDIVKDGVRIAQAFMTEAIPVRLIGMNDVSMCDYIEYIGDRLLIMLGYKKVFNKQNPFKFMETIGLNDKTNFFEERAHEYQDAHIMNKSANKSTINIKADF